MIVKSADFSKSDETPPLTGAVQQCFTSTILLKQKHFQDLSPYRYKIHKTHNVLNTYKSQARYIIQYPLTSLLATNSQYIFTNTLTRQESIPLPGKFSYTPHLASKTSLFTQSPKFHPPSF